jgi:predicted transcriptional regulator
MGGEQTISVVLTEDQVRRVNEIATAKRVSRSAVLRWMVDHFFLTEPVSVAHGPVSVAHTEEGVA